MAGIEVASGELVGTQMMSENTVRMLARTLALQAELESLVTKRHMITTNATKASRSTGPIYSEADLVIIQSKMNRIAEQLRDIGHV